MKRLFPEVTERHVQIMTDLAHVAFADKFRDGPSKEPYENHLRRVKNQFNTPVLQVLGMGHDFFEDRPAYALQIVDQFPPIIVDGIRALSRLRKDEPYFSFIYRLMMIHTDLWPVIPVKLEDLMDNSRDSEPGSRKDKYLFAMHMLINSDIVRKIEYEVCYRGDTFARVREHLSNSIIR